MRANKPCLDCGTPVYPGKGPRVRCCPCSNIRTASHLPAQKIAAKAIRKGTLIRQPCEVCGAAKTEAHHDDYSRPLDVRWLCKSHHRQHHVAERRAAQAAQANR
jgi:hypothetical protein